MPSGPEVCDDLHSMTSNLPTSFPPPPQNLHARLRRLSLRRPAGWLAIAGMLLAASAPGCSGKRREVPPLGEVTGVVSLDGGPLPRAAVAFVPYERGNGSYGTTDEAGRYTLQYAVHHPGAVVGRHRVEIRTGGEGRDKDGNFVETPEQLPAAYHAKSQLEATVAAGLNEINFDLTSRPAPKPR